jgi:HAD superfamily hydrolase (TIGR01549 family)
MHVLWDFDGTLFDTYPSYTRTLYKALNERVPKEDLYRALKVSFSHAIERFKITRKELAIYHELEENIPLEDMPPFTGVREVLEKLKKNVIMTHKPRREVETILAYWDMTRFFEELVCGDDGYPRKPDPASYVYLHEKFTLDLAIGDREIDILPAKAIGLKTCLFQNTTCGADFYLDDYADFSHVVLFKF